MVISEAPSQEKAQDQTIRPCARAFFVYYVAILVFGLGPLINPKVGIPVWLGVAAALMVVAAVLYMRGQVYRISARGLVKTWRGRTQEITWGNLGEVEVRRGLTQTLLRVGNLFITARVGDHMFWFGLANPKEAKALIDGRRS